ncbi:MAG: B12-binding domain-containing radical SAM protein [Desulfobacterales bacterium]|nr:B12-binding domain-containing radical SAM protein [Desulfobacterales bacterium]
MDPKTVNALKVLIIVPGGTEVSYPSMPLGVYRLKTYLARHGFQLEILDLSLETSPAPWMRRIEAGEFAVVGMSVTYFNIDKEMPFFWELQLVAGRAPNRIFLVAGGQQATINPNLYLEQGFDLVFLGYAEEALLQFCLRMEQTGREISDLRVLVADLPGIAVAGEQESHVNFAPALTQEGFRRYAHDLLLATDYPYDRYWNNIRSKLSGKTFNAIDFDVKTFRLYTSSVCPMGCGFCSAQAFLSAAQGSNCPIYRLPAEDIISQIFRAVHSYGAEAIFFNDDNFIGQGTRATSRIATLCDQLTDAKRIGRIPAGLSLHGLTRIDSILQKGRVNRVLLKKMRQAGFKVLVFGVESFVDRLLKAPSINKRNTRSVDIHRVIDAVLAAGLYPQVSVILGIPETTVDEMLHTMRIAAEYLAKGALVSASAELLAMPGAPVYDMLQYPKSTVKIENRYSGQVLELPKICQPFDKTVHTLMPKLDTLYADTLTEIRQKSPWPEGVVPKFFSSLALFICIAKELNRQDDRLYFESILQTILNDRR